MSDPMMHPDSPAPDELVERRRDEFDALVARAVELIPHPFADHLESVAIVTEDEPRPDQQRPGVLLFGLYEGVPRTAWGASSVPIPCRITLFRLAHERAYPDPVARERAVEGTVLHEVAHHLGIDETTIRRIEANRHR